MSGSATSSLEASSVDHALRLGCSVARRAIACLIVLVVAVTSAAEADESAFQWTGQVEIGWQGAYSIGEWTPVWAEAEVRSAGSYQLHVTAPDPDGHRVTFSSPPVRLEAGRRRLHGFFKLGRIDPDLELRVDADVPVRWKPSPQEGQRLPSPLKPGTRLIVTVGDPVGFSRNDSPAAAEKAQSDSSKDRRDDRVVSSTVEQLPTDPLAYDSVSLLVLTSRTVVSADQSAALRDWIVRGGRLLLSLPHDQKAANDVVEPLKNWLPVSLSAEPVVAREFSSLEKYAGRNVRVFAGRLSIPGIRFDDGAILAGSRDDALLIRAPYGFGSVTVLALDLAAPPLRDWTAVSALGSRLVDDVTSSEEPVGAKTGKSAQLSSTGITDLATQLHAIQDDFASVTRASPWLAMGLMVVFLVLIGPVDYLVVHRALKRPRATWITFPLFVALGAMLASHVAAHWNGNAMLANQFNLINIDAATGTFRGRLWTNLYASETTRHEEGGHVSAIFPGTAEEADASVNRQRPCWSGIPETAFGGMYRSSGLDVGRGEYSIQGDLVFRLPLMQWSSKSLVTEVSGPRAELIESQLLSSSSGRLTGTLTHRLPTPIEDWFLVYGNRVYRHMKQRDDDSTFPLPSRQLWRVEQPNVFQRELRPFLTGQITVATKREGQNAHDVSHRQTVYDPLSRDPEWLARTLTFHEEAGGTKYTGLMNRLLEDEDLSHLLRLGRAILFGRVNGPMASIHQNGKDIRPDTEVTFVRLVLPVKKISETTRELERFDPNRQ